MASKPVQLDVEHHLIFVLAEGQDRPYSRDRIGEENGLVDVYAGCVAIRTGIADGPVWIQAEVLEEEPSDLEDGWEDIVEVSVQLPLPGARLRTMHDRGPQDWPVLNKAREDWYRLRVHCRGRDLQYDGAVMKAEEHYKVSSWPAPQRPDIRHRLTDAVGRHFRGEGPPPEPVGDDDDWDDEDDED